MPPLQSQNLTPRGISICKDLHVFVSMSPPDDRNVKYFFRFIVHEKKKCSAPEIAELSAFALTTVFDRRGSMNTTHADKRTDNDE